MYREPSRSKSGYHAGMRAALLGVLALAGCFREAAYVVSAESLAQVPALAPDARAHLALQATRAGDGTETWVAARALLPSTAQPTARLSYATVRARALDPRRTVGAVLLGVAAAALVTAATLTAIELAPPNDFAYLTVVAGVPLYVTGVVQAIVGLVLAGWGVEHPAEVPDHLRGWTYYQKASTLLPSSSVQTPPDGSPLARSTSAGSGAMR